MAEPKTRPTDTDVDDWLARLPAARRADCDTLVALMRRATGADPVLWGTSIVGFGRCALPYADGSTQDWPLIGFSPRARELSVYLMDGTAQHAAALARLGPHRTGKSCLYLAGLDRVDACVLAAVIEASAHAMAARHPVPGAGAAAKRGSAKRASVKRATANASSAAPATTRSAAKPTARKPAARRAPAKTAPAKSARGKTTGSPAATASRRRAAKTAG
jgi:hypothetical protein